MKLPVSFQAELVDPSGNLEPVVDWFTVQNDQSRYLRLHFDLDGQRHRLWASPFFPEP